MNSKQGTVTGGATTILTSNLTINRALLSDASGKVAVSATTNTELGYSSGVTSAIQTQFNQLTSVINYNSGTKFYIKTPSNGNGLAFFISKRNKK